MADFDFDTAKLERLFGTNKSLERDGAWIDYQDGLRVRIRRSTDPVFKKALRKSWKRFRHMGSSITPEQEEIIKDEAVANGLLTDWDGFGPPFSSEAALEAFKRWPDFRRWCEDQGDDVANFRGGEDDLGNSSGTSTGAESGEALTD